MDADLSRGTRWDEFVAEVSSTAETFWDLTQGQVQHIAAERGLRVLPDRKSIREVNDGLLRDSA